MNQQTDLNGHGWRQEASAWCMQAASLAAFSLALLVLAALLTPGLIAYWEQASGRLVSYEAGMRFGLAMWAGLCLLTARVFGWRHWDRRRRRLWNALGVTYGLLLLILALDWNSLLQEEYSWIRYPTAAALAGAGMGCLLYAWRNWGRNPKAAAVWLLLASGFCFAGLDEILQMHEGLGRMLKGTPYPSLAADLITLSYFAASLPVVYLLWRILKKSAASRAGAQLEEGASFDLARLTRGFLAAGLVFGIAQVLDTADKQIMILLQGLANWLLNAGYPLPDFWYLFSQPRQLCNSVEEILECTAAVLFLIFSWEPAWEQSLERATQEQRAQRNESGTRIPLLTEN